MEECEGKQSTGKCLTHHKNTSNATPFAAATTDTEQLDTAQVAAIRVDWVGQKPHCPYQLLSQTVHMCIAMIHHKQHDNMSNATPFSAACTLVAKTLHLVTPSVLQLREPSLNPVHFLPMHLQNFPS